ncbi:hypothetical protein M3Y14_27595 [Bacillus thuringiensis]|uniref:hypothetical protein n=1 Tax=Bacillus thuringiensis TaxID=1428 RepID=UPI002224455A|nr:hypothetical protein [Bacillus thuringiensis]UYX52215.1 hypothetical protein M3Y14_27595 [Bacillus thuringiensis]
MKLLSLSKKDIINKNLKDICRNKKVKNLMYSIYQKSWVNELGQIFTVNINDTLYFILLHTMNNEECGKIGKGYCIPLNENEEFKITDSLATFNRSDFI